MNDPKKYTIGDLIHNVTFSLTSEFIFSDDPVLVEMKRKAEALDGLEAMARKFESIISVFESDEEKNIVVEHYSPDSEQQAIAPKLLTAIEQAMKETK